jgi:hypothetical protein
MFAYQGHAWEDLGVKLGKLSRCHGAPPDHFNYAKAMCPICGLAREWDDLSIEHAPQQGGQSSFGPTVVRVLTCRLGCNNNANTLYEQPVSIENQRIGERPLAVPEFHQCGIHGGDGWVSGSGLVVPRSDDRRFMVDLKSAFLIAFVALGYRWALSAELAPIREAIRTGVRPSNDVAVMATLDPGPRSVVMDVAMPFRSAVVQHRNGAAFILPTVDAPRVPVTAEQLRRGNFTFGPTIAQEIPWPTLPKKESEVRAIMKAGHLFHYDHCQKHLPGYW